MESSNDIGDIPQSQQVHVSMGFLRDLQLYNVEKPYHLTISKDRESDTVLTNIVHDLYNDVPVTNVRGSETYFELDTHGFQLARHRTSMSIEDFGSPELVQGRYFPEMAKYLEHHLGAREVRIMFYNVRRRSLGLVDEICEKERQGQGRPIPGIHIDASADGALKRIQDNWPSEVRSICEGRYQILNVWRPLGPPLRDWPLALCDVRSVNEEDKVKADLIYPGYEGENTLLYFSPHYRFYFVDGQKEDEIWIFKQFDSASGVAGGCPHGSFKSPQTTTSSISSQSIDIAALVIY
ncbi:hypothetical protein F5Y06DRAFT_300523 [Hypoxylon sp. FL0890]|nr:hypothetical protein F5Y06DRAFT_300523 [Hypoxylon sp. FL0890]